MALAAYRHILRSTRILFKGISPSSSQPPSAPKHPTPTGPHSLPFAQCTDDLRLLHAARHSARQRFNDQRSLAPSSPEAVAGIEHAEGVAVVLRQQVVQGARVEDGSEEGGGGIYQLRIHSETERGDNSTIKMGDKNTGQVTRECCGASQ